jgi:hypothetical protein
MWTAICCASTVVVPAVPESHDWVTVPENNKKHRSARLPSQEPHWTAVLRPDDIERKTVHTVSEIHMRGSEARAACVSLDSHTRPFLALFGNNSGRAADDSPPLVPLVVEVWLTPNFLSRCRAWCSSHIAVLPSPIPHPKVQLGRRGRPWLRNCLSGRSGRQAALPDHLSYAIDFGRQLQRELVGGAASNVGGTRARHPTMVSHTYIGTADLPPLCFSPQRVISIWFGPAPVTIS